ncbi:MAG: radical SAM protein [Candidatus Omnitrophica bacterium]|nr:radical SAM protein [Candidatus Omnitrophota bacterium]
MALQRPWKKALLVVPPTGKYIREERCQTPLDELHTVALRPPMDLLYIAGALEQIGVQAKIVDYPAQEGAWESFENDVRGFQPDALILSITTPTLEEDVKAAAKAKSIDPEIVTLSKGAHFLHLDRQAMRRHSQLDLVMRGEYEETVKELASGKSWSDIPGITYRENTDITRNEDRPFIQDIDAIAFPARHLIDNDRYRRPDTGEPQATIVTSRGCPYPCIYCLARAVSGAAVRNRSPENVAAELKECIEKHGIRDFLFRSDLFTANKRWVLSLCKAIQDARLDIQWSCNSRVDTLNEEMLAEMKKAGCWLIAFGVEHGDPVMLELMRKQVKYENIEPAIHMCRKAGIKSSVYFLIGLPWESRQTFEKTKSFARKLDPDFIEFFYTYPFYGTEYYEEAVKEQLLQEGELPKIGYNQPAIPTKYLTIDELKPLRKEALRSFYLRPRYIIRTLAANPSPKVLFNYFRYGIRQLWDLLT